MPHLFLSDEWIAAARAIREQHDASTAAGDPAAHSAGGPAVRMNLTVTGVPFGAGTVHSYIDTSAGSAEMELGQLDEADVSLTTDYDTARTIFVLQDQAAGMQAFMTGKIVVQGDMMQLLALNASLGADPRAADVAAEILAMTA